MKRIPECIKFPDSSSLSSINSSTQLAEDLKIRLTDGYKTGDGHKKISKPFHFHCPKGLRKSRSERPKNSDSTACTLERNAKQNPHMTAKDLLEGLTRVVVHHSTVQHCSTSHLFFQGFA